MNRVIGSAVRGLVRLLRRRSVASAPDPRIAWEKASTCAVICGAGIGDALMAMPLLRAIRSRRPRVGIVVVTNGATASVFAGCSLVDEVVSYGDGTAGALRRLLRLRADVVLAALPSNTIRHSLLVAAIGAPVALKHAADHGSRADRDYSFLYSEILPLDRSRHRVEANLDLLRRLGEQIPEGAFRMEFAVSDSAERAIDEWCRRSGRSLSVGTVAMHPGGGGEYKFWPWERFAVVAGALADAGYAVCLVGGAGERELCAGIVGSAARSSVYSVAGEFALAETAALLRRCTMFLGNDTGIMHLAVAVGLPVLALFGPTDPRHIGPLSEAARVVRRGESMESISVEEVVAAALDVLSSGPRDDASNRSDPTLRSGTNHSRA